MANLEEPRSPVADVREVQEATPAPDASTPSPTATTREVKVKLPTEQVLRLHMQRMKKRTSVSQIVSTALSRYFDDLAHGR